MLPTLAEATAERSPKVALASLDLLLGKLDTPSLFRGYVQFARAMALSSLGNPAAAREAIGESIRLLPGYSGPLLAASQIHAFDDSPGPAAEYLIRASRIDPAVVKALGDYEINNLLGRLTASGDKRRRLALSERLVDIGWSNGRAGMLSTLAMDVLEARMARGDERGAATMIPKILLPDAFARLLSERRFDPLRAAVETWAGARIEKQWIIYLEAAKADWEASFSPDAAGAYVAALASAGHYRTIVETFAPLFDRPIDPAADFRLVFLVPPVARAFAHQGKWEEAYRLYDKALSIWPAGSSANAINVTANRARLQLAQGKYEEALAAFDAVLADAAKWGGQVSDAVLLQLHQSRACALEQLGRREEAGMSAAFVQWWKPLDPAALAYLQLCRDEREAARATLIEALQTEDRRAEVLKLMQPPEEPDLDGVFARMMAERWAGIRNDAILLDAVGKYGRIRAEPVNAAAPPEAPPE